MKITLEWLGQSGFLLRFQKITVACDLYLSDFCNKVSRLDHTRLMAIPVRPEKLNFIDHYLITHSHIDHFDPETVGPILNVNPETHFYCLPEAMRVVQKYFPEYKGKFQQLKSFHDYKLCNKLRLIALPAAHEELEKDANGEYIAFSYLLLFDNCKKAVFFAGDTIPFEKQAQIIGERMPENYHLTLLLPVNGRDRERAKLGFKGNLTLAEAVELYQELKADLLIPCHFGMFALNDLKEIMDSSFFRRNKVNAIIPELNKSICLEDANEY